MHIRTQLHAERKEEEVEEVKVPEEKISNKKFTYEAT
jgi:hypothetical protein